LRKGGGELREGVRITYDPEANAAYIYLVQQIGIGGVAKSVPVEGEGIDPADFVFDFDRDGRLIGIEVLFASQLLADETLKSARTPGQPE
jgi:uncharacterized protein YuzE